MGATSVFVRSPRSPAQQGNQRAECVKGAEQTRAGSLYKGLLREHSLYRDPSRESCRVHNGVPGTKFAGEQDACVQSCPENGCQATAGVQRWGARLWAALTLSLALLHTIQFLTMIKLFFAPEQ